MPNWEHFRRQSIQPGGFGADRSTIWPELLDVSPQTRQKSELDSEEKEHRDERQILLDTDRSFVLYPVVDTKNKDEMKTELNQLIVSVFQRRPRLNYFQGYHDIISVLFLTLPQEMQLLCAEKISLYRLRDSMGTTLEPVIGLLRVLQKLIGLVDPTYASILDRNMPLPYYALSNLLTLFAHDVPTLPIIQHIFDFLLARPPIAAVYLAAAFVLCRKEDVYRLEEAGDEGMLHSLLTSLPDIYEEGEETLADDEKALHVKAEDPGQIIPSEVAKPSIEGHESPETKLEELHPLIKIEDGFIDETALLSPPPVEAELAAPIPPTVSDAFIVEAEKASNAVIVVTDEKSLPEEDKLDLPSLLLSPDETCVDLTSPASNDATLVSETSMLKMEEVESDSGDEDFDPKQRRCRVSLTSLLSQADDLYSRFPPSHSQLSLNSTMGPNSVVFTWSESPLGGSLSESEAEEIVDQPQTVVLPYVDPEEIQFAEKQKAVARRMKLRKSLFGRMMLERRSMLTGAILVLSVVIAAYGVRCSSTERHDLRRFKWLVEFYLRRAFVSLIG